MPCRRTSPRRFSKATSWTKRPARPENPTALHSPRTKENAMPYVRIEMLEGRTEEQKAAIAKVVTQAMEDHAGAPPQSVFVVFEDVARENWAVGGTLISQRKPAAS
ncbi:2-hydroxymuconate tautomerase [Bordetella genomosp. 8]|nr:2-hydroxymuconate tautomerase [Bordetella genomosp. 8]